MGSDHILTTSGGQICPRGKPRDRNSPDQEACQPGLEALTGSTASGSSLKPGPLLYEMSSYSAATWTPASKEAVGVLSTRQEGKVAGPGRR